MLFFLCFFSFVGVFLSVYMLLFCFVFCFFFGLFVCCNFYYSFLYNSANRRSLRNAKILIITLIPSCGKEVYNFFCESCYADF